MEQLYQATYDAWSRLVEINDGQSVVATMAYDGLGRRIMRETDGTGIVTYNYYYNEQWQLLAWKRRQPPNLELPGVSPRVRDHTVCLYTMSPDEHFIVDRHPAHANVVFAAGLSGHGFKFAPALGQALADLALDGATELPVGFLSLDRFA